MVGVCASGGQESNNVRTLLDKARVGIGAEDVFRVVSNAKEARKILQDWVIRAFGVVSVE